MRKSNLKEDECWCVVKWLNANHYMILYSIHVHCWLALHYEMIDRSDDHSLKETLAVCQVVAFLPCTY